MKTLFAAHHGPAANQPVTRIVIHATCPDIGWPKASAAGRAHATARYFATTSRSASAHYVCDAAETIRCLPDTVVGYHAPPNHHSIGVEICADGGARASFTHPGHAYTRQQWLSPQVWPAVARAAALTRQLCARHHIPARLLTVAQVRAGQRGICGHDHVSLAFGKSDHDDPGPWFPWAQFMRAVTGATTPPAPAPTHPTNHPAPAPAPNIGLIEEDTMKGCYYEPRPRTRIYLLFDPSSGFWHEFSNGAGNGPLSSRYINPIAALWDTGSWPRISPGHARVLKAALDRVRKHI